MNVCSLIPLVSVAPFAGAWIETIALSSVTSLTLSLPSRERGLKLDQAPCGFALPLSLPSRERGLKPVLSHSKHACHPVAPFAGAWIETVAELDEPLGVIVAPFAGAWIETGYLDLDIFYGNGRSLRGSVD